MTAVKKMVNYYPANAAGVAFWTTGWDPAQIAADFAKIAALGANTVRIFVHPAAIGYPVPDEEMLCRVERVVDIARDHGLRVHLTLFDLYPAVFADLPGSKTWAKVVLGELLGDPAIACVELHNEIPPDNPTVMGWVKVMLPYIRKVGGHPVTVSVADKGAAVFHSLVTQLILAKAQPDFYDYHFYGGFSDGGASAYNTLAGVKKTCLDAGRPLFIGETGQSTAPGYATEQNQALYYGHAGDLCKRLSLDPPGVWMLNDTDASSKESGFGLYRTDGTAKPSAAAVAAMFGAAT